MFRAISLKQVKKLFNPRTLQKHKKNHKLNHEDIASLKLAYGINIPENISEKPSKKI